MTTLTLIMMNSNSFGCIDSESNLRPAIQMTPEEHEEYQNYLDMIEAQNAMDNEELVYDPTP